MILKQPDDKTPQIRALETLLSNAPESVKPKIQKELHMLRAGIKGEQETTYHIDFHLRDSENYAVVHDLRLEINGNVAQIDHLLIHKHMRVYCIETKHFNAGIKINDDGEFMQWNAYKKGYEGIPSPLAQNQRHLRVLNEVFNHCISLPKLFGLALSPSFHSRVVINNDARIERSKKFDSKPLVKSEYLYESIKKDFENAGIGARLTSASLEDIENIARQLMVLHQPITFDYRAKFGVNEPHVVRSDLTPYNTQKVKEVSSQATDTQSNKSLHLCKRCNSQNVKIQYGKYGYYCKCGDCDGNTNIKAECGVEGHNAKIRKDGNKFYLECAACKSSHIYFENV